MPCNFSTSRIHLANQFIDSKPAVPIFFRFKIHLHLDIIETTRVCTVVRVQLWFATTRRFHLRGDVMSFEQKESSQSSLSFSFNSELLIGERPPQFHTTRFVQIAGRNLRSQPRCREYSALPRNTATACRPMIFLWRNPSTVTHGQRRG